MTALQLNPTLTMRWSVKDGTCLLVWITRHEGPRSQRVSGRVAAMLRRIAGGESPSRWLEPDAQRWLEAQQLLVPPGPETPRLLPPRLRHEDGHGRPIAPGAVLGPDHELVRAPEAPPLLLEQCPWGGHWASWELDEPVAVAVEGSLAGMPVDPPALGSLAHVEALATPAEHRDRQAARWRWCAAGRDAYARDGYAVLAAWPPPDELTALAAYARRRLDHGYLDGDFGPGGKRRSHIYDDPALRGLHQRAAGLASTLAGRRLVASYSFLSIYHRGGALPRHRDKPHCAVSMSLALEADESWPLHLDDLDGRSRSLRWATGQLVLFDGRRFAHARPPLPSERAIYLVLHFQPDPEAPA